MINVYRLFAITEASCLCLIYDDASDNFFKCFDYIYLKQD